MINTQDVQIIKVQAQKVRSMMQLRAENNISQVRERAREKERGIGGRVGSIGRNCKMMKFSAN